LTLLEDMNPHPSPSDPATPHLDQGQELLFQKLGWEIWMRKGGSS
jgi:hypothetical protein